MLRSRTNRTGKPLTLIYPGEHYATNEDCYIGTVVGTCLAVCIFDSLRRIGGMVNFVIPGSIGTESILDDEISRVGIINMEYLMGDLVKLSGDRHRMKAKIFGAGATEITRTGSNLFSEGSIKFVREYFALEKIPIEKSDLGGNFRRKIYFSPVTGTAYKKILSNNQEASEFIALEKEYVQTEFKNKDRVGRIVLFD